MLLTGATSALAAVGDSARTDAALLLAQTLRRSREWLVAHDDAPVSEEDATAFERLCARRRDGMPIAYILGTAEFYGRSFVVNEDVLVPRPETEHLIDEALAFIDSPMRVLDLGTGSGAIACTLAAERPVDVVGTDLSPAALAVAAENARRLGIAERCRFVQGNLAESVRGTRFGAVVANLPYVPTSDLPRAPAPASFEPRTALDGGADGLALYRELMPQLPPLLENGASVWLEAAPPTIEVLVAIARGTFATSTIEARNDYGGRPRFVSIRPSRPA
jgi:release factor glutamine methyltransferase